MEMTRKCPRWLTPEQSRSSDFLGHLTLTGRVAGLRVWERLCACQSHKTDLSVRFPANHCTRARAGALTSPRWPGERGGGPPLPGDAVHRRTLALRHRPGPGPQPKEV